MVESNILEPGDVSKWVTPIVTVIQEDCYIQIHGDYKRTANQVS